MTKLATGFVAATIAIAFASGAALFPTPAEAAKMSKADKDALKQATVSCKAEAKGKKLGWFASRRYVKGCLVEALKDHPNIDVNLILIRMDTKRLPVTNVKDHM